MRCTRDVSAAPEQWLPVTVRGAERGRRLDALAPRSAVARTLRPEQLVGREELLPPGRVAAVPALAALPAAGRLVAEHRLAWGPIGAVGYELGTGVPVAGPLSPLRLVLRAPQPVSRRDALLLRRALGRLPVPVQAELETRYGAVLLAEYAAGAPTLTLLTPDGPREVHDPWFPRGRRWCLP
ncbi:phosphoribosyl-dephospho-CoA transferase MdcG domain-containing protein [Kitasatospora aburaviensis]